MSAAVVVVASAMAVLGAVRTGVSWDEPYHVMRLRNYLDHGWFALDWSFAGAGPASEDANTTVYAPIAMLLLHAVGVAAGVEEWGSIATTPAAYDVRHLGVVLVGAVGTAAAAAVTRVLLGSWRWALVTAAALLALPMWTGHLMFNIKDVPVASGYTLMTLGCVAIVKQAGGSSATRVLALSVGILLMVGTRPAMASGVLVAVAVLAWGLRGLPASRAKAAIGETATGVVAAAGGLVAVYPQVFTRPAMLLQSAEQSTSFRDGENAVLGYVPFHVATQVPLLLLGLFLVGLVGVVRSLRQRRSDPPLTTGWALVLAQLLALPLMSMVLHSDLYNGLRQLLFAAPAWAVVSTAGLAKSLAWAEARGRRVPAYGVAGLALAAPIAAQASLFPYQYTFYNVALDATGAHVATDYWRASVPELLPRIPTDGQVVCGPTRSGAEDAPELRTAGRYSLDSSVDCRTDPLGPLSSEWAARGLPLEDSLPPDEFYVVIDRDHAVPTNCRRLDSVARIRNWREVSMTYVARCHQDAPVLGMDPVRFVRPDGEPQLSPALWAYAPQGWVMRESPTAIDAEGRHAVLALDADGCRARSCALVLEGDAPSDLEARIDGRPAELIRSDGPGEDTVEIRLPADSSEVWLSLTRGSGEPLALRLRSLRLTAATDEG